MIFTICVNIWTSTLKKNKNRDTELIFLHFVAIRPTTYNKSCAKLSSILKKSKQLYAYYTKKKKKNHKQFENVKHYISLRWTVQIRTIIFRRLKKKIKNNRNSLLDSVNIFVLSRYWKKLRGQLKTTEWTKFSTRIFPVKFEWS